MVEALTLKANRELKIYINLMSRAVSPGFEFTCDGPPTSENNLSAEYQVERSESLT